MRGARGSLRGPWTAGVIDCSLHVRPAYREAVAPNSHGVEVHVIHTGQVRRRAAAPRPWA